MRTLLALAGLALGACAAHAADEPLWEAGIGVAGLHFPDYRGADRSRAYVLPAPYFVYRGEFLRADRHGLRGVFLQTDRVDLNLSVAASLPVRSRDIPAREGMPDLRPAVEVGPSLDFTLWRHDDRRTKLDLRLPVRGAVTVESDPRFAGVQFFPHLNVDVHDPAGMAGWNLGILAGPVFTDRRYNRYFYSVPARFASASRPAYDPDGGFGGVQFVVGISKRFPKYWVGAFARYDSLRGAAFEDSPLVASKGYFAAGVAISWIVRESSRRVPVGEFGERVR